MEIKVFKSKAQNTLKHLIVKCEVLKLKSQRKIAYGIWVVNFEGNWIPKLVPNQIVKINHHMWKWNFKSTNPQIEILNYTKVSK